MVRHVFVTGQPGVGKTTLVRAAVRSAGLEAGGFYTEERRSAGGNRLGFDVVDARTGAREKLATASDAAPKKGTPAVGKYAVHVADFEAVAVPALRAAEGVSVLLLDEVGKMELLSDMFFPLVRETLDGDAAVLGTLPTPRYGHPPPAPVREVAARSDVVVLKLSKANRDDACEAVAASLRALAARGALDLEVLAPFVVGTEAPAAASATPAKRARASAEEAGCGPLAGEKPVALLVGETASPLPDAPGREYAERSFWKVLGPALGGPADSGYDEARGRALAPGGVCAWDVLANVHVRGAKKPGKADERPNDILSFLADHPTVRVVGFNGAKARTAFLRHADPSAVVEGGEAVELSGGRRVALCTLPSSSGANSRQTTAQKSEQWRRSLLLLGSE